MKYSVIPVMFAVALSLMGCGETKATLKETLTGTTKGQYQKPGAPVNLSYTSDKVNVGDVSNIQATLHLSALNLDAVQVVMNVDEGVTLLSSPGDNFSLPLQPNKLDYPLMFSASSYDTGLRYINLVVTTTRGAETQNRAFSIPVQAGTNDDVKRMMKASNSPVQRDASGTLVVPMQAEEVIR